MSQILFLAEIADIAEKGRPEGLKIETKIWLKIVTQITQISQILATVLYGF